MRGVPERPEDREPELGEKPERAPYATSAWELIERFADQPDVVRAELKDGEVIVRYQDGRMIRLVEDICGGWSEP